MSTTGSAGVFGFAVQTARGTPNTTFWRHRASEVSLGPQQEMRTIPLEVGGLPTPGGAYKPGVFVAGGATLNPRLENSLGYLLGGAFGDVVSARHIASPAGILAATALGAGAAPTNAPLASPPAAGRRLGIVVNIRAGTFDAGANDVVVTATPSNVTFNLDNLGPGSYELVDTATVVTSATNIALPARPVGAGSGDVTVSVGWVHASAYKHTFRFDPADALNIPWMTFMSYIPGLSTFMIQANDSRMNSLRLTVPQTGLVQARIDMTGITPVFVESPTPSYAGSFEDYRSIPISCRGYVRAPAGGANLPLTSFTAQFSNNLSSPEQERVIGSYYPDDLTPLSRAATIQAVLKWNNPDLYQQVFTGATGGLTWDPAPYQAPLKAVLESPYEINATTDPGSMYAVYVEAPSVAWTANEPPRLAGGDLLMIPLQGQVMQPSTGEYFTISIVNAQASYTLP